MAEGVDAGELWLPSEFLADDFFPSGHTWAAKGGGDPNSPRYGRGFISCEFPLELDSNLGSPVEQATDVESDEEDYLAELTRQMAHAFLKENDDDNDSSLLPRGYTKGMAGSPQSTLCDFGAWSGSGKGSPDGASPTSTPSEQNKDDTWDDLLNAAAGEVVRLQQQQQQQQRVQGRGLLGTPAPAKHSIPTPAPCNSNTATGYFSSSNLTQQQQQQQLQAERFYQLKQQQLMKLQQQQQQQAAAPWGRQQNRAKVGASGGRPLGLPSSAWPPLQRQPQHQHQLSQPGSGMRALFLTGSGTRRESSGTGVFLPRRPGNPSDHRKKPACSTVLLPDRVIQALNLNLDDMDCHPRLPGGYLLDHDAMVARGNAMLAAQQKWNHYRPPPAANSHELRLPAEWTY